jgi:hypothetical protein
VIRVPMSLGCVSISGIIGYFTNGLRIWPNEDLFHMTSLHERRIINTKMLFNTHGYEHPEIQIKKRADIFLDTAKGAGLRI